MYGAQTKFGLARQAAVGSGNGVTAPTSYHPFPFTSEDIGLERDEVRSQNITGRFEEGSPYPGPSNIAGTIEFELTPRNLGVALAAAINHVPVTVTSGAVRTHLFQPTTVDYDSFLVKSPWSVYKQWTDANSAESYFDVQFGQLDLIWSAGALTRGRLVAAGGSRVATGIGSANIVAPAADIGVLYPWNVASVSLGGNAFGAASEISLSINDNVAPIYGLNGTLAPFKFTREGFRETTINFTFYMTNRDQLNDFMSDTARRLLIFQANTRAAVQSGYFNSLLVDIPQLRITAFKPGTSGPGEISVSGTARADIDPTSGYAIQFTLTNTWGGGY